MLTTDKTRPGHNVAIIEGNHRRFKMGQVVELWRRNGIPFDTRGCVFQVDYMYAGDLTDDILKFHPEGVKYPLDVLLLENIRSYDSRITVVHYAVDID
jgi:hypothetical protein